MWRSLKSSIFALLILVLIALVGCDELSSKSDVAESEINSVLDKLKITFRDDNIDGFMDCFFSDYLHNNDSVENIELVWSARMINFDELEFKDIEIDLQDDNAVVYCTLKLIAANSSITFDEPYDEGALSFFLKYDGEWKLHGNRNENRR